MASDANSTTAHCAAFQDAFDPNALAPMSGAQLLTICEATTAAAAVCLGFAGRDGASLENTDPAYRLLSGLHDALSAIADAAAEAATAPGVNPWDVEQRAWVKLRHEVQQKGDLFELAQLALHEAVGLQTETMARLGRRA